MVNKHGIRKSKSPIPGVVGWPFKMAFVWHIDGVSNYLLTGMILQVPMLFQTGEE